MWERDIVQSFNNCKKRCNAVLKVSFLERLHQEAIARYFLFHSDFQLNRPQISKKTVTKFQSSQKHNIHDLAIQQNEANNY